MNRMGEHFGQVALFVSVFVHAITEVGITVVANVLAVHTYVLTFNHLPTFIAPEISVIIVAFAHPLITLITVPIPKAKFL